MNELASRLRLTDNAVRANLARLKRDGMVQRTGKRASFRKPEDIYDITPDAERLFSKAYAPVLGTMLAVMEKHLDERELEAQLREVGRRLAEPHLAELVKLPAKQRVAETLRILEELGGLAEVERREGQVVVRGFGCPFSQIVGEHPKLCIVAEAMVSELLGQEVHERCQREDRPRCCFIVDAAEAGARL